MYTNLGYFKEVDCNTIYIISNMAATNSKWPPNDPEFQLLEIPCVKKTSSIAMEFIGGVRCFDHLECSTFLTYKSNIAAELTSVWETLLYPALVVI